jgi:hypothetical protein
MGNGKWEPVMKPALACRPNARIPATEPKPAQIALRGLFQGDSIPTSNIKSGH